MRGSMTDAAVIDAGWNNAVNSPDGFPIDLSRFENSWYSSGRSKLIEALWFFVGLPLLRWTLMPFSSFRILILRLFGSAIGKGVVIKPGVRVKYPWLLRVGDHSWLGEDVWIDNLAPIDIADNVCVSQGAYLCTGNHNWSDPAFGLRAQPITLRAGSWVGARGVVCPGVEFGEGSIAAAGSVVMNSLQPWTIHAGNPATLRRTRVIKRLPAQTGAADRD
jgi:putative colanic acid biosynthesis acetyltransferase WcaF